MKRAAGIAAALALAGCSAAPAMAPDCAALDAGVRRVTRAIAAGQLDAAAGGAALGAALDRRRDAGCAR